MMSNLFDEVVNQDFPNDIIVSCLNSVYDLRSLAQTSSSFHKHFMKKEYFRKIILQNVNRTAIHYGFSDINAFNEFLTGENLVVSGSCALYFLGHSSKQNWTNNDMDLYAKNRDIAIQLSIRLHEGKEITTLPKDYKIDTSHYNDFEYESNCYKFLRTTFKSVQKIQIILNFNMNVNEVISKFDLNLVKNMYDPEDGGKYVSFYPMDVINCRTIVDYNWLEEMDLLRYYNWNFVNKFVEKRSHRYFKYLERGYEVSPEDPMIVFKRLYEFSGCGRCVSSIDMDDILKKK